MKELLIRFLPECIGLAIALCILIIARVTKSERRLKAIVFTLVVEAEKLLGGGTGTLKKEQVIEWFFTRYPVLSIFMSRDRLGDILEEQVSKMQDYLEESKCNKCN